MKSVLIINDLHIPFNRHDVIEVIKKNKDRIDTIIFGGDIIDCFEISSFPKLHNMSIEYELIEAIEFLQNVRSIVSNKTKIILIRGNHEKRWQRYIATMRDKALYRFLSPNVLNFLRDGFTSYTEKGEIHYNGVKDLIVIDNWYINYKGIIVCHPDNFSRVKTKNSIMACDFFLSQEEKFHTIVCAHNHQQGFVWYKNKACFESGCSCRQMTYLDGKTNVTKQDSGYVIIKIKNKSLDFNKSSLNIYK